MHRPDNPRVAKANPAPATNFIAKKPTKQLSKSPSVNQNVNQIEPNSTRYLATKPAVRTHNPRVIGSNLTMAIKESNIKI